MAEYGKIYKKVWRSRRFLGMSENAQRLLFYGFSSPDCNALGLYVLKLKHLALDWKWKNQQLNKALKELLMNGWVDYDDDVELILIHGWFDGSPAHHSIQNDGQFKRVLANLSENPRSLLHQKLIDELNGGVKGIPDRYLQPFIEQLTQRLPQQSRDIVTVSVSGTVSVEGEVTEATGKPVSRVEIIPYVQIINHLNQVSGRSGTRQAFKTDADTSMAGIRSRWNEGATFEDFCYVHMIKAKEWLDTDMEKHLNPSTLYRPGNFEKYRCQREILNHQLSGRAKANAENAMQYLREEGIDDGSGQAEVDGTAPRLIDDFPEKG